MGEWVGEGTGAPGEGSGGFSFRLELDGRVLLRHNQAEYPATKDHPAFSHRDLMVVYPSGDGPTPAPQRRDGPAGAGSARAIYFDNEGHVIQYTVRFSDDRKAVTLLSDPIPSQPRYRLTYGVRSEESLTIKFEIAPPSQPDAFKMYVQSTCHRTRP